MRVYKSSQLIQTRSDMFNFLQFLFICLDQLRFKIMNLFILFYFSSNQAQLSPICNKQPVKPKTAVIQRKNQNNHKIRSPKQQ